MAVVHCNIMKHELEIKESTLFRTWSYRFYTTSELEGKCNLWRCKFVLPYYVVSVDKYWQWKGSSLWIWQQSEIAFNRLSRITILPNCKCPISSYCFIVLTYIQTYPPTYPHTHTHTHCDKVITISALPFYIFGWIISKWSLSKLT